MASDERRFIELSDILAFRFECKKCGSFLSVPPAKYLEWQEKHNVQRQRQQHQPLTLKAPVSDCPVCAEPWALLANDYETAVTRFAEKLKELADVIGRKDRPLGFSLTLEIKGEKQSE